MARATMGYERQRSGRDRRPRSTMPLRNLGRPPMQLDPREALQQHLERDPSLQARERRAEAVVDAAPEREVGIVRAADIEPVGRLEHVRVPVGGADQDGDVVARADLEPVHRAVGPRAPDGRLRRGIEAQQLLDGRRDEAGVVAEPGELVRVVEQRQHAVADQVGGGLVAGDQQEAQHVQHLALAQPLAAVLGMGERAQDVVAGRRRTLLDDWPEPGVERLAGRCAAPREGCAWGRTSSARRYTARASTVSAASAAKSAVWASVALSRVPAGISPMIRPAPHCARAAPPISAVFSVVTARPATAAGEQRDAVGHDDDAVGAEKAEQREQHGGLDGVRAGAQRERGEQGGGESRAPGDHAPPGAEPAVERAVGEGSDQHGEAHGKEHVAARFGVQAVNGIQVVAAPAAQDDDDRGVSRRDHGDDAEQVRDRPERGEPGEDRGQGLVARVRPMAAGPGLRCVAHGEEEQERDGGGERGERQEGGAPAPRRRGGGERRGGCEIAGVGGGEQDGHRHGEAARGVPAPHDHQGADHGAREADAEQGPAAAHFSPGSAMR